MDRLRFIGQTELDASRIALTVAAIDDCKLRGDLRALASGDYWARIKAIRRTLAADANWSPVE